MQGLELLNEKCYNIFAYECIILDYTLLHLQKGTQMEQNQNPENQSAFTENNPQGIQNDNYGQQQSFQTNNAVQMSDPFFEEYQAPIYATEFKPIKKKINPLAVIVPVCVAVIAAAAVLMIFLLNKTDYKKSEKEYFNRLLSSAQSSVEEKENTVNPQSVSINFQSPLSNLTGNILDISNIDFNFDGAVKGKDLYNTVGFKMGDIDISGEYWLNSAKKTVLLSLPQISDIFVKFDLNGAESESKTASASEYVRVFSEVLSKTADTYFELIGDVAVEKDQSFVVGFKTYTADKAEIHLNSQQIAKLFRAFYNNLLDNEDAVKLLCDSLGYENKDELKDAIDNRIDFDTLDKAENGEDYPWALDMTVYMKNKEIIGRNITVKDGGAVKDDDKEFGAEFYNIPTQNGSVKYISASRSGKTLFSVINEDAEEGGVHSGTVEITAKDKEAALSYSDFAITDTLFQGKAELTVKNSSAFSAKLELKTEGDAKTTTITVPNIFTLTVKAEPSELEYKEEPQLSDNQLAVLSNDENSGTNENFNKFMNDFYAYINQFTGYGNMLGAFNE